MLNLEDTPLSPQLLRTIDPVCDAFEQAWQQGARPTIEDHLGSVAEVVRPVLLAELIRTELEWRCRRGEQLAAADYEARFPALAGALADWLAEARAAAEQLTEIPPEDTSASGMPVSASVDADADSRTMNTLPPPPITRVVGEYEVLMPLGSGGMGEVFKARHRRLGRLVALKVLSAHWRGAHDKAARFLREIKALGSLDHPNVVEAHDAGEEDGVIYLAMKLIDGIDLDRLVRQGGPLPVAQACEVARQAAVDLHERRLVHRHVKPSNLMRAADGSVKILDLGLARWHADTGVTEDLTGVGQTMGTPDYLAPEQAQDAGEVDIRTDLYALGGTLFYLLTGRPPFGHHKGAYEKLKAHEAEPPPDVRSLRPEVPAALAELVCRLLAKKPADRPQTPAEVAAALEAFNEGITPHPEPAPAAASTRRRRAVPWRAVLAVAACLVVVALGVAVPAFWRDRSPAPAPTEPREGPAAPAAAVRVLDVEVAHLTTQEGKAFRTTLGSTSFETRRGDGVTVEAHLSRPAYAYLISFRPDGADEVCFPEKEDEAPLLTDRPRYPSVSQQVDYGLDEGAGLQVFAVVVSSRPLPAYREWRSQCGAIPWQKDLQTPRGVVWWVHDNEAEALTADPGGQRGKGRQAQGKTPVVKLTEWLRQAPGVEGAAALGFAVLPAPKR
jgi:hypothetical protein